MCLFLVFLFELPKNERILHLLNTYVYKKNRLIIENVTLCNPELNIEMDEFVLMII